MGLDMCLTGERYLHSHDRKRGQKKGELYDLGYWRKHPNLHGYIVSEFASEDDCNPIYLGEECLRTIIAAIKQQALPITDGFFFGKSDGSEQPRDLRIFTDALAWVEAPDDQGWRTVYYQASW